MSETLLSLACLSLAFTLNAGLDRFIWFGSLREGSRSRVPSILIVLIKIGIYAAALMLIVSTIFHRDVTAIAATSGVVAIVLGYSLQPTLSEVFAGLALNLSGAFKAGDRVLIEGVWGNIQEATWRSVSVRTDEANLVIIPNTRMATQRLTNLYSPDQIMGHRIGFTIDIDVPPGRVQSVGLTAMKSLPNVLKSPAPMLLFKDATKYGFAYEAIFWHSNPDLDILRRDEVGVALWYAFRRAGIPFSVLRRNLAHRRDDRPVASPIDLEVERRRLRDALEQSPLFSCFHRAGVDMIVERHRHLVYGPNETVVRQNEEGTSMFVILEGAVRVLRENAEGFEREIATLGTGEAFGHMSLMTGAARSATVRATGHLVLAEIEKAVIAELLEANPTALTTIAEEIVRLDAANQKFRELEEAAPSESGKRALTYRFANISKLMRGFFGLGD